MTLQLQHNVNPNNFGGKLLKYERRRISKSEAEADTMKIDQKLNDLNFSIVLKVSFYPVLSLHLHWTLCWQFPGLWLARLLQIRVPDWPKILHSDRNVQTSFSLSRHGSGGGLNGNCVTLNTITISTGGQGLIIILINAKLSHDYYYDYVITYE